MTRTATQHNILNVANDVNFQRSSSTGEQLTSDNQLFEEQKIFRKKDDIQIVYRVRHQWQNHFVLAKGLIEFTRTKDLHFTYNLMEKSFTVSFQGNHLASLKDLLNNIQQQLKNEIQFRRSLKVALDFEHQYRLKCASLYSAHFIS